MDEDERDMLAAAAAEGTAKAMVAISAVLTALVQSLGRQGVIDRALLIEDLDSFTAKLQAQAEASATLGYEILAIATLDKLIASLRDVAGPSGKCANAD